MVPSSEEHLFGTRCHSPIRASILAELSSRGLQGAIPIGHDTGSENAGNGTSRNQPAAPFGSHAVFGGDTVNEPE